MSIPGPDSTEAPLPSVAVVALPYDRDSVIRALEAAATAPKPSTQELDSLFQSYRTPFQRYSHLAMQTAIAADSLTALRRGLAMAGHGGPLPPEVAADTLRLARLAAGRRAELATARAELDRARAAVEGRGDSLRKLLRDWEKSTYKDYERITTDLVKKSRREPVVDSTDAAGRAALTLAPGDWWVHAKSWNPDDPNAEWYWNVKVGAADTLVVLDGRTGRRHARY